MKKTISRIVHSKPRGATSLLIVVGISLVFIVIISGLTALSIRESRQALSTDLSNRALAAAESYVKQTAQDISDNPSLLVDNDCENPAIDISTDANNVTQITCKTVTAQGTTIEREVEKDKTSLLFGIKGDYTMKFSWGKKACEYDPSAGNPRGPLIADYIDLDLVEPIYRSNEASCLKPYLPSVMELMFFSWNDDSLNAINGIQAKTVLIMPKQNIVDVNQTSPIPNFNGSLIGTENKCKDQDQTTGYQCSFEINLAGYLGPDVPDNVAVLVRPRYAGTNYLAEFKDSSGQPVVVQSNTALIDVTARVGDYYRRATGQLKLDSIQNTNAISDVVYSKESICKRMTVGENFNQIRSNICN